MFFLNQKKIAIALITIFVSTNVILFPLYASAQVKTEDIITKCGLKIGLDFLGGLVSPSTVVDESIEKAKDEAQKAIDVAKDAADAAAAVAAEISSVPVYDKTTKTTTDKVKEKVKEEIEMIKTKANEQKKEIKKASVLNCIQGLVEMAFKVALAKFKKQLLDRITDDTISWISGENPKYFTDFGKLFRDSADAALGDTLSDVIGSDICQPLRFNLNLGLTKQRTPFTQQTSCTLSKVVDNIENFQKNFSAGGWIGYNESLKPQNNPFGAQFLVQQELQKKEQANAEKQQAELITSAGGTKSVEQCTKWEARLNDKNGTVIPEIPPPLPSNQNDLTDPNIPPASQPLSNFNLSASLKKKYSAKDGDVIMWACEQKRITNPSLVIGAITGKAVTSDTDYVANADDLSSYIFAIFDAAVNRLIKAGAKGLQSAFIKSDSGTGRVPTPYDPGDKLTKAGDDYKNTTSYKNLTTNELKNLIASSTEILSEASSTLQNVTDLNTDISNSISTTLGYKLFVCETARFGQQGVCSNTSSTIKSANSRIDILSLEKSNLENVRALINQAKNTLDSLSENELISLTVSISTAIENLKLRIQTLNALKSELQRTKQDFESNLDQCKKTTETYVCNANNQP